MTNDESCDEAIELARRFFVALEEEPEYFPESNLLRVAFRDEDEALLGCYVHIDRAQYRLVVHTVIARKVDEPQRAAVAEYMTRMNYELQAGCFVCDLDDGEIGYRTGVSFRDMAMTPELVRNAILENVSAVEACMDTLVDVIEGAATPREATEH